MIQNVETIEEVKDALVTICGRKHVFTKKSILDVYSRDQTPNLHFPFDILVKPGNTEEIAAVMKCCNRYKIPVTPRCAGNGVTGGALPIRRGVVVSLERLNKIIEINILDEYVIAESGVITMDLCAAVEQKDLYFPVISNNNLFSSVGGNVAGNAGSMNSYKYGTTKDYLLNLEVVLPTGDIIWTGANVNKNSTGLNLTQLFAGSEGILGIITKVVYRLIHKPACEFSVLAGFDSVQAAIEVVKEIKKSTLRPSAVELIGTHALELTSTYLKKSLPLVKKKIKAQLLIHLSEENKQALKRILKRTKNIIANHSNDKIWMASNDRETDKLWKLHHHIVTAVTNRNKRYRNIDAVVPLSRFDKYVTEVERICNTHQIEFAYFGHALDGNLHVILMSQIDTVTENEKLGNVIKEIYSCAVSLGGVLSGEQGIGYLQKEFMPLQFPEFSLMLMKKIKALFDPNYLLNPGKII